MLHRMTTPKSKPTTRPRRRRRGRLIVIEGADGTGKATQAELLVTYLRKVGVRVKYYDFPQYYHNFFGDMVGRFLRGEYGAFDHVSPYLASLPYALDRASVAGEMSDWLDRGGWVVCNRFVSSHLAHQSAKIDSPAKRRAYIEWDQHLEYEILGTPREDLVICLDVPHATAVKLTLSKKRRTYLKNKRRDISEVDLTHQRKASDMYVYLSRRLSHWRRIRCTDRQGRLLPIASIHNLVVQSISS